MHLCASKATEMKGICLKNINFDAGFAEKISSR